jgi:hypothetical protein
VQSKQLLYLDALQAQREMLVLKEQRDMLEKMYYTTDSTFLFPPSILSTNSDNDSSHFITDGEDNTVNINLNNIHNKTTVNTNIRSLPKMVFPTIADQQTDVENPTFSQQIVEKYKTERKNQIQILQDAQRALEEQRLLQLATLNPEERELDEKLDENDVLELEKDFEAVQFIRQYHLDYQLIKENGLYEVDNSGQRKKSKNFYKWNRYYQVEGHKTYYSDYDLDVIPTPWGIMKVNQDINGNRTSEIQQEAESLTQLLHNGLSKFTDSINTVQNSLKYGFGKMTGKSDYELDQFTTVPNLMKSSSKPLEMTPEWKQEQLRIAYTRLQQRNWDPTVVKRLTDPEHGEHEEKLYRQYTTLGQYNYASIPSLITTTPNSAIAFDKINGDQNFSQIATQLSSRDYFNAHTGPRYYSNASSSDNTDGEYPPSSQFSNTQVGGRNSDMFDFDINNSVSMYRYLTQKRDEMVYEELLLTKKTQIGLAFRVNDQPSQGRYHRNF